MILPGSSFCVSVSQALDEMIVRRDTISEPSLSHLRSDSSWALDCTTVNKGGIELLDGGQCRLLRGNVERPCREARRADRS